MNERDRKLLQRRYAVLGHDFPLFYKEPLHIVRGQGVWLYDATGRQYLDVYNNVAHVGHCHPHVVEAIARQAATLNTHTRYLHETIVEYAERLTATFGKALSMATFTCTGSEANELALRIARHCTKGEGIIVSTNAYHGNTEAVWELATTFTGGKASSPRVRTIPIPDSYRLPDGVRSAKALAGFYADRVQEAIDSFAKAKVPFAGMLVCPDFANEGLVHPPKGFMEEAVRRVHAAGGLFIADEVQAGFGRSGKHMWAHQWYDIRPDIATMGKPMGNGHPIAGLVVRPELLRDFAKSAMYFNTFGGNPVSCAAGMAVLDVLEQEHLLKNALDVGRYMRTGLEKLKARHDLIGDVRDFGMFFAAELVTDRTKKTPAPKQAARVMNGLRARGVMIGKIGPFGSVLKMRPPMVFSRDNADLLLSTLDDVLAGV